MLSRSFALAIIAAASAFADVDPVLLNLVMPDAKVLTGIQVSQSLASPFGQYVLSHMQPDDPGFTQFITATGFDPTKNLTQILAATGDTTVNPNNIVVLGRGTFVPTQIASAAIAAGANATPYNGFNILTFPGSNANGSIVFLDNNTTAIGNMDAVKAVVDRWNAKATYSGALATSALAVGAANSAWFTTQTPLSDFLNGKVSGNLGGASQSNLFQSVVAASGGISFQPTGITMNGDAVTTSAQNAQALVDVLKFLASMISSNANNSTATGLINSASFTANGSTTHISLSIPEQQAEQLFMNGGSPNARPARKRPVQ
jgi:hypothetical protein